jgi:hypothetical protein
MQFTLEKEVRTTYCIGGSEDTKAGLNTVSIRKKSSPIPGIEPGLMCRARSVVIVPTALPGALYSVTRLQSVLLIIHLAMAGIRSFHRSATAECQ